MRILEPVICSKQKKWRLRGRKSLPRFEGMAYKSLRKSADCLGLWAAVSMPSSLRGIGAFRRHRLANTEKIKKLAPAYVYPGEDELKALALGAFVFCANRKPLFVMCAHKNDDTA